MKKVALLLLILLIIILISAGFVLFRGKIKQSLLPSPTPTPTPTPVAGITFLKGGDKLSAGKSYAIKWNGVTGATTQIFLKDLSLESQGESVSLVDRVYNVPNTGSYSYTIPASAKGTYILEIGPLISSPFTVEEGKVSYCLHDNLVTDITTEGAAGNIYGTLKLQNLSSTNCSIIASNFIEPEYTASNVTTQKQGNAGPKLLNLTPNETVYSQFHAPNGPQCSEDISPVDVSFKYNFAPNSSILFEDENGNAIVQINACKDATSTQVDVWSIYPKPVGD